MSFSSCTGLRSPILTRGFRTLTVRGPENGSPPSEGTKTVIFVNGVSVFRAGSTKRGSHVKNTAVLTLVLLMLTTSPPIAMGDSRFTKASVHGEYKCVLTVKT
jgi:hypothetical protein